MTTTNNTYVTNKKYKLICKIVMIGETLIKTTITAYFGIVIYAICNVLF